MISQIQSNFDKILGPTDDDAQYKSPNFVQDKKKSPAIPETTKNQASNWEEQTPNFPKTHKSNPKIDSTRHSNPNPRPTRPKKKMFYDDSTDNSRSVSISLPPPNNSTRNSHIPLPPPRSYHSPNPTPHQEKKNPSRSRLSLSLSLSHTHTKKSPKSSAKKQHRSRRAGENKLTKEISKSKSNLLLNKFLDPIKIPKTVNGEDLTDYETMGGLGLDLGSKGSVKVFFFLKLIE